MTIPERDRLEFALAIGASVTVMRSMRPWPEPYARAAVIFTSLMLLLAIFNLLFNTDSIASWFPLIIIMPWLLYLGVWSLRNQDQR